MSLFKRHPHPDEIDTDEENEQDGTIDPELRLRTVRTAASTIAESVRSEARAQHRSSKRRTKSRKFFRKQSVEKKKFAENAQEHSPAAPTLLTGPRRNVYVNITPNADELDMHGTPLVRYVRNKVRTTSECHLWISSEVCLIDVMKSIPSSLSSRRTSMNNSDGTKYCHGIV